MQPKKVLIVFGTRPEAIKMAPLVKEFKKYQTNFLVKVLVTGQHRKMLDQVLELFQILPDYDLDIMEPGQDLFDITTKVLVGVRDVFKKEKPDLVLVHGDTTTSTAASLGAFYLKIPIGHVEAGLRTYDLNSPWPEELNRQLTGRIANFHFTPTELTKNNLLKEGVELSKIVVTGNTVIDALMWAKNRLDCDVEIKIKVSELLVKNGIDIQKLEVWRNKKRKMILITAHRRENFGKGFLNIFYSLKELSKKFCEVDFIYPMHLNPNVREALTDTFGEIGNLREQYENIFFIEPVEYLPFVYLMDLSYLIMTDSGGIQEEAPSLGKPVIVMRDTSERPEAINAGTVRLVGSDNEKIVEAVSKLLLDSAEYNNIAMSHNPYGDGMSSEKIVKYFL